MPTSSSEFLFGLDPFEQLPSFPWETLFSGTLTFKASAPASPPAASPAESGNPDPHPPAASTWEAFPEPRTIPGGWDLSAF
jgi:hypothetical protein